ncbi:MAG TPA: hypothetical protein IGS52_04480 [Oscillatoriaceae cyanobacterium M33_DOE_052]|uniref:Uncharacterized protein n=1 Tax=Planktothricoides sp. SpSt-374 TaxID=2282167 RepID=A0A7C3ZRF0_9CYAN|nr:hypothetical protein [Oscillatoriaceae cyanobacterium M33_DOE_052]
MPDNISVSKQDIVISINNETLDIALTPAPLRQAQCIASPKQGEGRVGEKSIPVLLPFLPPLTQREGERGWGIEGDYNI